MGDRLSLTNVGAIPRMLPLLWTMPIHLSSCRSADGAATLSVAVSQVRAYFILSDMEGFGSWMLSLCVVADVDFLNDLLFRFWRRFLGRDRSGGEQDSDAEHEQLRFGHSAFCKLSQSIS
jgi:hypothetical protein